MTKEVLTINADSYPVAFFLFFWGERRLGVRLRRARGVMSLPMTPPARLNLPLNLLSPQNTKIATGYESTINEKTGNFGWKIKWFALFRLGNFGTGFYFRRIKIISFWSVHYTL